MKEGRGTLVGLLNKKGVTMGRTWFVVYSGGRRNLNVMKLIKAGRLVYVDLQGRKLSSRNPKSIRKVITDTAPGHTGFTTRRNLGGGLDTHLGVRHRHRPRSRSRADDPTGEKRFGPTPTTRCPAHALQACRIQGQGGVPMALYNNKGIHPLACHQRARYGYDLAVNPRRTALTSSFTGYANYMRPSASCEGRRGDEEVRQHHGGVGPEGDEAEKLRGAGRAARDPLVAQSQGQLGDHRDRAHLEALARQAGRHDGGEGGRHHRRPGEDPAAGRHQHHRDGKGSGSTRSWTARRATSTSNPEAPKQTYEKVTGKQVNMISQSWDGKRVYITSSLLANWDKGGATTSSSCAASRGTARSSRRSSRSTSPRRSSAARTT